MLILGGAHPNEPAGYITAALLVENISVERGRVFVIPRANRSGFTHTEPGEAHPHFFEIPTPDGPRRFRYGCRFTNPLDQWPDPEVYLHYPSGQRLSGTETRNLNRAFPGRASGNFTERLAFAITQLIEAERVDLVIDLHEASPEYPVINAIVAHERAMDVAALANLNLQAEGLQYSLEPSPTNFRGLTHREIGDATLAMAILMESANLMQGRLRGRCDAGLILDGQDPWYLSAARAGLVRVPYDETGIPLEVRVGRHLAGVQALTDALAFVSPDRAVSIRGIPSYADAQERGMGAYLIPKTKQPKRGE
ncbi:succinylglutamate desuccinylase/aspartoacylase family protein [bacterium]|nr:succinylglutamate desuccinylase/aspartoacylase family protein [bacterium]MBU1983937.1 succinylglutamate desuccinylase/aspartoacylase family protein [bacterium]